MIPLFSAQQVRNADALAINEYGFPSIILMENAARSIFEEILNFAEHNLIIERVGIVCGKGNNGGDGFAIARHFLTNGINVHVVSLGGEEELKGDALINFSILSKLLKNYPESKLVVFNSTKDFSGFENCQIIIDALLGTGYRGELNEPYKSIVEKLNLNSSIKVAVDIPSGLDLDNSTAETIFEADLTVTLAQLKTGLYFGKGYVNSGKIVKGSIGIGNELFENTPTNSFLMEPEDAYDGLPLRKRDMHKYSAGKLLVVAGSHLYPGASVYTANSALKAGIGACFLAVPSSVSSVVLGRLSSAVVKSYNDNETGFLREENLNEIEELTEWADVICLGPGLGRHEDTLQAVREIIKSNKNKCMLIDADALYALSMDEYTKLNLKDKVLTPHHKEFADLIGISVQELEMSLLEQGSKFAKNTGCTLVLKGAPSIVFDNEGNSYINSVGNPGMAKFGTGDVLSGMISAFLAQSIYEKNILDSSISALYLHSLAADILEEKLTEYCLTPELLIDEIPSAIKLILRSFS
ncbi:MAG: NAD(P)H-hydrate dehydratase [Melioribacteraceae bacterium]|nr:NAD(P)H-hydrate dehydratase [Melioribacteraceae bacterium]